MEIANIMLALGGDKGNSIPKFLVTASEIAVLREIHGEDSVSDVEPLGERKTSHRAERERLIAAYGNAKKDERPVVDTLFPGVAARLVEKLSELELPEEFFKATQRASAEDAGKPSWDGGLRKDGPTIGEWLDRGYLAEAYPPSGYEARSTPEEIDAAVAARANVQPVEETIDDGEGDDGIGDLNDGAAGGQPAEGNVLG